jgi:hypothetical protein
MKRLLFSFLFVVIFFLTSDSQVSAAGKIYYVAGDVGLDTYTSAEATNSAKPWKTIQKAATTMTAGDTVNVKGGVTYSEQITPANSGTLGNPITYRSWDGTGIPTIDGANKTRSGFVISAKNYINIKGFRINKAVNGIYVILASNIIFSNNVVESSTVGVYFDMFTTDSNVFNNTLNGNIGGMVIGSDSCSGLTVKNNISVNNTLYGINSNNGYTGIVSNNNLFYNNGSFDYGSSVTHGVNDITGQDPLFVDPANGDFRLQPNSPAINMGADLSGSGVTTDILGRARPKSGAFDIGAYEDTNYYVAGDTGNNSNVGSSVSPWLTIQKAADTMVAGDTVNVKGGVVYSSTTLCFLGMSMPSVVCGKNSGNASNYITYQAWSGTGVPIIDASDAIYGFQFGDPANAIQYVVISGFIVRNTSINNPNRSNIAGISVYHNSVVKNNLIYNTAGSGIANFYSNGGRNITVVNNTIYGASNIGILVQSPHADVVYYNNVVVNTDMALERGYSGEYNNDYNLFFGNTNNYNSGLLPGTHDILSDPLFVDPGNSDFRLQPNSPAINAGADLSANGVITDILGIARPQGSGFDIGAYEYYEMPLSSLSSSGDTKDNVKPVLSFKKSSTMASGISSYSVSLDPGKNKSYSITGIPASGNGSSFYTWRDDTDTKVWFTGEDDSDSSNDTINVYFKGLDSSELTEGKHTWSLTTYDSVENSTSKSFDLYIDKTLPTLTNLSISGVSSVTGGSTYSLTSSQRMPVFTGKVSDPSQGSEKTNSNGTKDTFDAVSSGVDKITLTVKKLGVGGVYKTYLTKDYSVSGDFSVSTPFPLTDGKYEVGITIGDKAGNVFSSPPFYLTLGVYQTISTLPFTLITSTQALNQTQTTTGTLTETPLPTPSDQTNDISKPTGVVGAVQTVFSVILSFFKNIFRIFLK